MKNLDFRLEKIVNSRHNLTSAKIQLDLLARLLSDSSTPFSSNSNENTEVIYALEDIFFLVHMVRQKVDALYRCVSTEFQLPNSAFSEDFNDLKKTISSTLN